MIKKVLIIRFRRIGDAVLSGAICTTLRKNFPEAQIHYVLYRPIDNLFENHPDIDRVIAFPSRENVWKFLKRVRQLMREEKYDVIVDTRSTLKSLCISWFSLSTQFRIGTRKRYSVVAHNYRIANQKEEMSDEVTRNLLLLKPLEQVKPLEYISDFRLYVSPEESRAFRSYMEKEGIDFSKPIILCSPFTRVIGKEWDLKKMKEVLTLLVRTYNAQLIFNYNKLEKEIAFRLYEEMGRDKHLFIHVEADSLRKLSAMMLQVNFFFGNEGGPRHMAQALHLPGLAIYPPRVDKIKWLPGSDERYQGISPREFMTQEEWEQASEKEQFDQLTVERVWNRLRLMLDKFLSPNFPIV